ncbi:FAD dependent oxidoreductase [Atractiella rhizophila]|nr:FAD dependent oxidoreductase [Atractiella rhizophila]
MSATFVIVGGGIVGCCTAYFLSQSANLPSNAKIIVIETGTIAAGASGKSGGFLALDWHSAATASLAKLSFGLHASLANEHDGATKWGYRRISTLSLSYSSASKRKTTKSAPPEEVSSWLGSGINQFSAIGTKETTAQVTPGLFTREILELAKKSGKVDVFEGYEVDEVKMEGKKAISVRASAVGSSGNGNTLNFDLSEGGLVVAAGPWAGMFAKSVLGLKINVGGRRAHSIVIEPNFDAASKSEYALFTELQDSTGSWGPEVYPRADGAVYICGPNPAPDAPIPARVTDVVFDPIATQSLVSQVASLSPEHFDVANGKATLKTEQACYLPTTSKGPGLVGSLGDNIVIGAGLAVWGITLGPGTGLCLSELLLEGKVKSADIRSMEP